MLYIVGTPIGNLGDMTFRAVDTLKAVDFVCAEDTRVTAGLLAHFGIKKPLVSYYEHNKLERGPQIVERLKNGENAALVTDAGMPGISDPGEHLVRLCIEAGVMYTVVPGPSAFVAGCVISGISTKEILFLGFLPENKKQAREKLDKIAASSATVCLYESPYNLRKTLALLEDAAKGRQIALCREITKIYEEVIRGTAEELSAYYEEEAPRGEYVIVIEGAAMEGGETAQKELDDRAAAADRLKNGDKKLTEEFVAAVEEAIGGGMKRNEAVKTAGERFGLTRAEAYNIYSGSRGI